MLNEPPPKDTGYPDGIDDHHEGGPNLVRPMTSGGAIKTVVRPEIALATSHLVAHKGFEDGVGDGAVQYEHNEERYGEVPPPDRRQCSLAPAVAVKGNHVRAAEEPQQHDRPKRGEQKAVVEGGVVDASKGQDEADVKIYHIDDGQKVLVGTRILDSRHVGILLQNES